MTLESSNPGHNKLAGSKLPDTLITQGDLEAIYYAAGPPPATLRLKGGKPTQARRDEMAKFLGNVLRAVSHGQLPRPAHSPRLDDPSEIVQRYRFARATMSYGLFPLAEALSFSAFSALPGLFKMGLAAESSLHRQGAFPLHRKLKVADLNLRHQIMALAFLADPRLEQPRFQQMVEAADPSKLFPGRTYKVGQRSRGLALTFSGDNDLYPAIEGNIEDYVSRQLEDPSLLPLPFRSLEEARGQYTQATLCGAALVA